MTTRSRFALLYLATLSMGDLYFPARAHAAPRHVTKPVSSITVKVVRHEDYARNQKAPLTPWRIKSADLDSCSAWVDTTAPNVSMAEPAAFLACRHAIDVAVDAAHAASERIAKGGVR